MKQIRIESVAELIQRINDLPNHFLYRGQANAAWQLMSSLERVIGKDWSGNEAEKFEDFSLKLFCSKFHLYDRENIKPESKLAWLSIMQHYGVPTRLIDFTESPYVALYFALETYSPDSRNDLALYAIDYTEIINRSIQHIRLKDKEFQETNITVFDKQDEIFEKVVDRFLYDIAWIAEPKILNYRLDRQAGSFLLSGNRSMRIEDILGLSLYAATDLLFVIPADLCKGIFVLLRKMNITSKSIYGDLDGLARSIRMQMQMYSI